MGDKATVSVIQPRTSLYSRGQTAGTEPTMGCQYF